MDLKIIASDMDGTFLDDNKHYDIERFSSQLDEMNKRGIHFVAASGNKFVHLKSMFEPILKKGHQISYVASNGAAIYEGDHLVHAAFLSKEQLNKVITWNAENPSSENNLVILTGLYHSYVSNHASEKSIEIISEWYHHVTQVEKFANIKDQILEVTFIWKNTDVAKQVKRLRKVFGSEVHSTGSGFGNVDVLAAGINKAKGLEFLQNKWQVDDDQVAVFGDNENDLEMLKKYKYGFVMKNADDFMKRDIFFHTVKDNNNEGVLDMIDRLLAGQDPMEFKVKGPKGLLKKASSEKRSADGISDADAN
ncbi:Cof-type HAD-IIB family hydrolase [Oenococcus alcoholitolerans]|uniref:Cof-type HAD-IIB family hydrolase n=1 Tax=Oenococcus alcoholitolerans TaxID=931074 RepID=UPI003F721E32